MPRSALPPAAHALVATAAAVTVLLTPLAAVAGPAERTAVAGSNDIARDARGEAIDGPDVASYQHPYGHAINWNRVRRDGKDFAIVKATEGNWYKNPWFRRDYVGARKAGLVRGSYHFARPRYPLLRSARHQARFFVAHLRNTNTSRTLPPALDLEATGGLGRGALVTWAQAFLLETRRLTGRTPMIYTYPYFWSGSLNDAAAFERYPLWMASYSGPADPTATLWQYTAGAHVAGIRGNVDMSRFMGPEEVWDALRDGRTPSPWPAATPGSPVHVRADAGDARATVYWLPGDTGSTRIRRYRVTAEPGGESVVVSGTTTQASFTGLTNGTDYTFTVTATNSHGDGLPSNPSAPVRPMVPTSLVGSPVTVTVGHGAGVNIRLTRPDRGHGLPGRQVTVERRIHGSTGAGWRPLRTMTTGDHGWVRLHFDGPRHTMDLRFSYDGPTGWRNAQRVVTLGVRNGGTAKLSRHHVRRGHTVTLRGHVRPRTPGLRVVRQGYYHGRWHNWGSTTTGAHGGYRFTFSPTFRGTVYYRVVVAKSDGRWRGYSPMRVLRIR